MGCTSIGLRFEVWLGLMIMKTGKILVTNVDQMAANTDQDDE